MSRLGKHKAPHVAKQHSRQLIIAVQSMGNLDGLIDLQVAEEWLNEEVKRGTKQPGTLDSYFHTVALFFDFLAQAHQMKVFSSFTGMATLRRRAQDWRQLASSLQKDKKKAAIAKKELGYCKLILSLPDLLTFYCHALHITFAIIRHTVMSLCQIFSDQKGLKNLIKRDILYSQCTL